MPRPMSLPAGRRETDAGHGGREKNFRRKFFADFSAKNLGSGGERAAGSPVWTLPPHRDKTRCVTQRGPDVCPCRTRSDDRPPFRPADW
jgi:hypothetical protein